MKISSWIGAFVAILVVLLASSSTFRLSTTAMAAAPDKAQVTLLYDAFGKTSDLQKDWGFAAFIEYGGKRILFDTGNNAEIFAHNVKVKGIDLTKLDFVVVSHRHGDHTSGLNYVLSVNPSVPIYAPKENFGVFGAELPGTFYRRNESLPSEMRYFDGKPPETLRLAIKITRGKMHALALHRFDHQCGDVAPRETCFEHRKVAHRDAPTVFQQRPEPFAKMGIAHHRKCAVRKPVK